MSMSTEQYVLIFRPFVSMGMDGQLQRASAEDVVMNLKEVWRIVYRVIHKSLWDFRTRLRNNQDRHGRKEHINR